MKTKAILLITLLAGQLSCSSSSEQSQINTTPFFTHEIQAVVDSIYQSMTMDERAAQLHGVRPALIVDEDGKLSLEKCREIIPFGVGHVSQYACMQDLTPNELRDFVAALQDYLINETRTGLPAIFHEEAITGFSTKGATVYPQQMGVACAWNINLVEQKSRFTRESMLKCGGRLVLSPMVDIIRNQHFNRAEESFGEDAYLTSRIGVAFVDGFQGDDLKNGVATCTKHFLGYGGGIDSSEKELIEEILMPHEAAMKVANNKVIMTGYHSFNGETAATNSYFIQDILRDYLSFDGLMVSDYFAVGLKWQNKNNDPNHFAKRGAAAMNAGTDLELCDGETYPLMPELIKQGAVDIIRFEEAVKRNLAMKVRLGLLDKDAKLYDTGDINLDKPEYRKLAYDLAAQSVVLLKNNGVLPLKSTNKIALLGPNANSHWAMLGDYTYHSLHTFFQGGVVDPNYPKIHTLKDGMEAAMLDGMSISYERAFDWDETGDGKIDKASDGDSRIQRISSMLVKSADKTSFDNAKRIVGYSDVAIVAVGENIALSGEGRTRKGISLPGKQQKYVEQLIDLGKPVVVIVFGGRAQILSSKILNGASAILHAWYPGEEGGNAVADILVGKVNPSGRLAVSYPATSSQQKICYNYGTPIANMVAFPFGYGLSYSSFKYSKLKSKSSFDISKDKIEISVQITNTGSMDGYETVQLYVSPFVTKGHENTSPLKPIQLKGFEKVFIKAGETKSVEFSMSPEIFASYIDKQWVTQPNRYVIKIGSSSSDIHLKKTIKLTGDAVSRDNREIFFSNSSHNSQNSQNL